MQKLILFIPTFQKELDELTRTLERGLRSKWSSEKLKRRQKLNKAKKWPQRSLVSRVIHTKKNHSPPVGGYDSSTSLEESSEGSNSKTTTTTNEFINKSKSYAYDKDVYGSNVQSQARKSNFIQKWYSSSPKHVTFANASFVSVVANTFCIKYD